MPNLEDKVGFLAVGIVSNNKDNQHTHVPEAKSTKLDNKSLTCVLLRVSEESKGYKLFDLVARRVVMSKDMIFEEKWWDWDGKQIAIDIKWDE